MIDLADQAYAMLIEGLVLLGVNPVQCSAIGLLREFSLMLIVLVGSAVIFHIGVVFWLERTSRPLTDRALVAILHDCVRRTGLGYVPGLFEPPPSAPLAFSAGGRRGAIYLSSRLLERLDAGETRAVILHELAHLRERDQLFTSWFRCGIFASSAFLLQAWVLAFFFQSSTLHFGSFRAQIILCLIAASYLLMRVVCWKPLGYLRELDCDDIAIRCGARPEELASALVTTGRLKLERRGHFNRIVPFESALVPVSAGLELRVRRLLDGRRPRFRLRTALRRLVLVALIGLVLFVTGFHIRSAGSSNPPRGWAQIVVP